MNSELRPVCCKGSISVFVLQSKRDEDVEEEEEEEEQVTCPHESSLFHQRMVAQH